MKDTAILYVGCFTPDRPEFQNEGSSTAGNLFQRNLLAALAKSGLPEPSLVSYFPVASFPKHRKLFVRGRRLPLSDGRSVQSLGHINLGALKIVTLGLSATWRTLVWGLRNLSAKHRIALFYNLTAPPALPLVWVCRLLRIQWVPFLCDVNVPGEVVPDTLMRRIEFSVQKRLIPQARCLVVMNQAMLDDFAPESRALKIEGGVTRDFVNQFAVASVPPNSEFHVVFAGRLSDLNGIPLLLQTLRQETLPEIRVTIAGSGPLEPDVREAAKRDPRIEFVGLLPHDEVANLYRSASLLLNLRSTHGQSHRYVFPSKLVECLATARPLLTTDTGNVVEEFGEYVHLLREETPAGLADALRRFAATSVDDREERARKGQSYVRANKTWEGHANRLREFLEGQFQQEAA